MKADQLKNLIQGWVEQGCILPSDRDAAFALIDADVIYVRDLPMWAQRKIAIAGLGSTIQMVNGGDSLQVSGNDATFNGKRVIR